MISNAASSLPSQALGADVVADGTGTVLYWKQLGTIMGYGLLENDETGLQIYFNASATRYSPVKAGDRVSYRMRKWKVSRLAYGKKPQANLVEKIEGDEI